MTREHQLAESGDSPETGGMLRLIEELYPICRSITGDGVRRTLDLIGRHIPLEVHEVPSGTRVFDWTVPKEWNIRDAYVIDPDGNKIIDFKASNLHVLNYSVPVDARVTLDELKKHLYTLPEHPDWIPYRTSYYQERWGFCLTHNQYQKLKDGDYSVYIDSTLTDGSLTYGEYFLPGESGDEILISCHVCHPSLCNDNLSGIALTTFLAKYLAQNTSRRYSCRFLFIPGTIGSITWLAHNEGRVPAIKHGLVVVCVGDGGAYTYKRSRRGNAEIDRAVLHTLKYRSSPYSAIDFYPYGYDERQYCSPAFNLPVGSLSRTSHGCYPEYHTSADDLDFIHADCLQDSLDTYRAVISVLENNRRYINLNPKCEPQLGKRGLYNALGAQSQPISQMAMLWVLNLSDGEHDLLDIAERANISFVEIEQAANALLKGGLLDPAERRKGP
jgi:aminopeptidase-like protein